MRNAKAAQEDKETLGSADGCESARAVFGRANDWRTRLIDSDSASNLGLYVGDWSQGRQDRRQAPIRDDDSAGKERYRVEGRQNAVGERTEAASQETLARLFLVC